MLAPLPTTEEAQRRQDARGGVTSRLEETVALNWPTAKASDDRSEGTGGSPDRGLDAMARAGLLGSARPTPAARDWKESGHEPAAQARNSPCLPAAVQMTEWPTPSATPYGSSNNGCPGDGREEYATKGKPSLEGAARQESGSAWPTATASDAKASGAAGYATASGRHSGTTLTDAAVGPRGPESPSTSGKDRAWSTPTARDEKGPGPTHTKGGRDLATDVKGRLNHRWVAQLMGFPADWLDDIAAPA